MDEPNPLEDETLAKACVKAFHECVSHGTIQRIHIKTDGNKSYMILVVEEGPGEGEMVWGDPRDAFPGTEPDEN